PAHDLVALIAPELIDQGLSTEAEIADRADWFADVVELLKPRSRTLGAIATQMRPFLAPTVEYEPAAVAKHWKEPNAVIAGLAAVQQAFDSLPEWTPQAVESALRQTAENAGVSFGKLVHPLRLALTGSHASPGIDQVVWLSGRQLVAERIEAACDF